MGEGTGPIMNSEYSAAHDYLAEHAPDRPELAAAVVVAAWLAENPPLGLVDLIRDASWFLSRAGLDGLAGAVGAELVARLDRRPGMVWRGRKPGEAERQRNREIAGEIRRGDGRPADFRRPMLNPAPIDLGPWIEQSIRRERDQVEAFLREFGANPETHHHVVYPAPDDQPGDETGRIPARYRDYVHVLIPIAEYPPGVAEYPTRDEACRRWPHRRIWQDSVTGAGPR